MNDFSPTPEIIPTFDSTSEPQLPKSEHPFSEIVRFAIIALIIVIPIRMFVAQPFIVSGASMDDTFENGQYLIVDQLSYYLEAPERGDVVVFRYPKDPSKYFIKRVIGVPGDTLTIEGNVITVVNQSHIEGATLSEPYVDQMSDNTNLTEVLGEKEYFVMGDNRDFSSDSRSWGILTEDKIIGRALVRLFPIQKLSLWPGKYDGETLLVE